ncbi:MAG: two-component sensor histidine kinase [Bacteroidota bacterium]|nr:two-component sensor histidine kinase [Bacteroidota bacterium]
MDKLSPRTLTVVISFMLALGVSLIDLYFEVSWLHFVAIFLLIFLAASSLLYYVVDIYLRNRIKLVYKIIHQFKLNKSMKEAIGESTSDDPLSEMETQVKDWVSDKSKEIEDLQKLEKFRKEFLANLSHELKTPIFNIQGYIHTLLDGAMEEPEVMKHFLERTVKSIDRLNNLVDDLDEISKIERGEVSMVKEIFEITQLVKEVFESMELKAKTKSITLSVKKGFEKPFFVNADKEKIRQVITNLIDNSIKYGKENGETVASYYDMDDNILIEITDNGIGISEQHLPRLFERFYRIDKHRSREQGGTGLGLAIVKHIIEAHQQTINVRSTVGVGTTFAFTLEKSKG